MHVSLPQIPEYLPPCTSLYLKYLNTSLHARFFISNTSLYIPLPLPSICLVKNPWATASFFIFVENVTITLPEDQATLSVIVVPTHVDDEEYYTFKWSVKSAPKGIYMQELSAKISCERSTDVYIFSLILTLKKVKIMDCNF